MSPEGEAIVARALELRRDTHFASDADWKAARGDSMPAPPAEGLANHV